MSAGAVEPALKLIAKNIMAFQEISADYILTGCASCSHMISNWPDAVRLYAGQASRLHEQAVCLSGITREFTELAVQQEIIRERRVRTGKTAFHVPCHSRFSHGKAGDSWSFLEKVCGDSLVKMDQGCCGHGGTFSISHADVSSAIFNKRIAALERCGAVTLVTTCSGCLMQWRSRKIKGGRIKVLHAAELGRDTV
jgi:glycolate oxidase iron-sulfur subunit